MANGVSDNVWLMRGLVIASLIIILGCSPGVHDSRIIFKQVADLMNVQVPEAKPWIFVVNDGYAVSNIAAPYVWCPNAQDRATIKGVFIPPCLIYLSRKDLSEALLAHAFAHFLGADEKEAERVQLYFDGRTGGN
ncbi:hypothetical protein D4S03_11960 [bacterium]|nr:MAG: hypothetical protein D4S03_11960 [bacterium]